MVSADVDQIVEVCNSAIAPSLRWEYEQTFRDVKAVAGEETAATLAEYVVEMFEEESDYPRPGLVKRHAHEKLDIAKDDLPRYPSSHP